MHNLQEIINSPIFNQNILLPQVEVEDSDHRKISLSIDRFEKIEAIYFENISTVEQKIIFYLFSQLVINKNIHYANEVSIEDIYQLMIEISNQIEEENNFCFEFIEKFDSGELPLSSPVLSLFKKAYVSWSNKSFYHCELSGRTSSELVCRCFGVYESQIIELINQKNGNINLNEVQSKTKASIGCGSCADDVKNILMGVQKDLNMNQRLSSKTKSPIRLALALDEFLQQNLPKSDFKNNDFQIILTQENHVFFQKNDISNRNQESFKKWLNINFIADLKISFQD